MSIDNQRAVSELLRSADKSIKEGNLDSALASISKVFEFDQRNVYARAYQERILSLKEMQIATRAAAEKIPHDSAKNVQHSDFSQPKSAPPHAKGTPGAKETPAVKETTAAKELPTPKGTADARATAAPQETGALAAAGQAAGEPRTVFVPLPESVPEEATGQSAAAKPHPAPQAESAPPADAPSPAAPPEGGSDSPAPEADRTPGNGAAAPPTARPTDVMGRTPARLEAYRTLLAEIWAAGAFTAAEEQRINALRQSFAITDEEHTSIEREIRFTQYIGAIEQAWKKGITSFEELRKQFHITDQEHLQIEGRVFRLLQSLHAVGTILVIDDDVEFLQLASRQLTEAGYYCVTVPTCEEALFILESLSPHLVLCDVNFSKPNMSGFAFYEKFRHIDRFFNIPFIFLSGMVQEAVQRTGMQMGADSYFTKPIDLELFLATIEGKIKRSNELQQRLSPHRL